MPLFLAFGILAPKSIAFNLSPLLPTQLPNLGHPLTPGLRWISLSSLVNKTEAGLFSCTRYVCAHTCVPVDLRMEKNQGIHGGEPKS